MAHTHTPFVTIYLSVFHCRSMYFHCHVYTVYIQLYIYIRYISILIGIRNHGGMTIAHFDKGKAAPLGMKRVVEVIRNSDVATRESSLNLSMVRVLCTIMPLTVIKKISLGCTTLYNLHLIVRGTFFFHRNRLRSASLCWFHSLGTRRGPIPSSTGC